ncbi:MAG: hypothetical protein ACYDA3_14205 [Gaiellaceae bacterium]
MAASLFEHHRHPRTTAILEGTIAPIKVVDELKQDSAVARFNAALAIKITSGIGSMWCAYVFALIALIGLPGALKLGTLGIVQWIAQTFLQLVLLSIIIVGQNIQASASDQRSENTYKDAEAVLHEAIEIQKHLEAQDAVLTKLAGNTT